jgi:hypothetical protein
MKAMTPLAKVAAIAVFCSGLAFMGLLAGGDHRAARARIDRDPMKGYYQVSMPRYPGVKEYPLTRQMAVGKAPMKMSYFNTKDDPLKICRFYADRWRVAGHKVTQEVTLVGGHVSAVDTKNGVIKQIIVTKQSRDRYLVFPSVTHSPHAIQTVMAERLGKGDTAPVFPGAEGVSRFKSKDPGSSSRITRFVSFGELQENVEFYRTEMAARGWKLAEDVDKLPGLEKGHHVLVFKKGAQEATINFTAISGGKQVRVHITEVGSR